MGDTLFGKELSATDPLTRGGTQAVGADLQNPSGRLVSGATTNALGFDPSQVGTGAAASRILTDPRDQLQGLFSALVPFEQRQTDEAVAGVRSGFGAVGGRFGRNAADAEIRTRGELGDQFRRSREENVLELGGLQAQLINALNQASLGARGQTLDFFQPQGANFQEGIAGDLLDFFSQLGSAAILAP